MDKHFMDIVILHMLQKSGETPAVDKFHAWF